MRTFVVGDIHGCYNTFRTLIEEELVLNKDDKLVLLGDYIDRGPYSKQVIDYILKLIVEGYHIICIRGNHEEMMLKSRASDEVAMSWLYHGGWATLDSFSVKSIHDVPVLYWDFLEALPFYHQDQKAIYVHAGLNFINKEPLKDFHSMLWSREMLYDDKASGGRYVFHGHTPFSWQKIQARVSEKHKLIGLDNGCCYNENMIHVDTGGLVAISVNDMKLYRVLNRD